MGTCFNISMGAPNRYAHFCFWKRIQNSVQVKSSNLFDTVGSKYTSRYHACAQNVEGLCGIPKQQFCIAPSLGHRNKNVWKVRMYWFLHIKTAFLVLSCCCRILLGSCYYVFIPFWTKRDTSRPRVLDQPYNENCLFGINKNHPKNVQQKSSNLFDTVGSKYTPRYQKCHPKWPPGIGETSENVMKIWQICWTIFCGISNGHEMTLLPSKIYDI